jgi:hypothetical protein
MSERGSEWENTLGKSNPVVQCFWPSYHVYKFKQHDFTHRPGDGGSKNLLKRPPVSARLHGPEQLSLEADLSVRYLSDFTMITICQSKTICEISGAHGGEYGDSLLGYGAE